MHGSSGQAEFPHAAPHPVTEVVKDQQGHLPASQRRGERAGVSDRFHLGDLGEGDDRVGNYRVRWIKMGIADALFESQSGFSTTGATVISDLEDPYLVPHCILFWRSSTHFLGGLGIIVLLVVILGHGSAGKAMMRAEMPGPTKEASTVRMQHTAWLFAGTYFGLNLLRLLIFL